jgi:hypothetical protein
VISHQMSGCYMRLTRGLRPVPVSLNRKMVDLTLIVATMIRRGAKSRKVRWCRASAASAVHEPGLFGKAHSP